MKDCEYQPVFGRIWPGCGLAQVSSSSQTVAVVFGFKTTPTVAENGDAEWITTCAGTEAVTDIMADREPPAKSTLPHKTKKRKNTLVNCIVIGILFAQTDATNSAERPVPPGMYWNQQKTE
ncbi:MAG: hypothetical protein ABL995_15505 [Bryobacteraceae bacterium]